MFHPSLRPAAAFLAAMSFCAAASAADIATDDPAAAAPAASSGSGTDLVIELGIGGLVSPRYEGADDYEVSPVPIISLGYLNLPGLFEIGSLDPQVGGFSIGPSFGYVQERDEDDLDGLDDVDATYEGGLRIGYEWTYAEIYGEARYAFGGADGFIGEAGANLIARPTADLELKAGPVISFASDNYMDAYFGVSGAESAASGGVFDAYDPDGGLKTAGVAVAARYEFRPDWFLNADASYNRLVGDAENSPVVEEAGSKDQVTFGLGLSKRFSLDLF